MLVEADSGSVLAIPQSGSSNLAPYLQYFGFSQSPFSSLPNKQFFCEHSSAVEMINTVTFSLCSGESIVKVTGVPGVGKTYLLKQVFSSLGEDYFSIQVMSPNLTAEIVLKSLVEELGEHYPVDATEAQLLKYVQYLLCEHYSTDNSRIVIWIDDAQNLSDDALRAIELLSGFETANRSLLQFVLSGSPQLDEKLSTVAMASLRDKITFSISLTGLSLRELTRYIEQRLRMVCEESQEYFSASALVCLFKKTQGIPRRINTLSHKALMLAFGKGDIIVKRSHVLKATKEDGLEMTINGWEDVMLILPLLLTVIMLVATVVWHWP